MEPSDTLDAERLMKAAEVAPPHDLLEELLVLCDMILVLELFLQLMLLDDFLHWERRILHLKLLERLNTRLAWLQLVLGRLQFSVGKGNRRHLIRVIHLLQAVRVLHLLPFLRPFQEDLGVPEGQAAVGSLPLRSVKDLDHLSA